MCLSVMCHTTLLTLLLFILVLEILSVRQSDFLIYWNVPTFQCVKYGYNFSNLIRYGIIQNEGDKFKGNSVTILYDPGDFPAIIDGEDRNGGIPQDGNLSRHLKIFKEDLLRAVPDPNFEGIGVIDFERWRPIFRQNWGKLEIYKTRSIEYERQKFPYADKKTLEKKASRAFEKSALPFIDETLNLAIRLRPKGRWGYYAFPYCFNFTPKNPTKECQNDVKDENNRSTWMYKTGTALYPSTYLTQKKLNEEKRAKQIQYKIMEALRIAEMGLPKLPVYGYIRFKYPDTAAFLSQTDMKNSISLPKKVGADGVVIWGSSKDVDSDKKCDQLQGYLDKVLGPITTQYQ